MESDGDQYLDSHPVDVEKRPIIVNTIPYNDMEWIKPKHSVIWNGSSARRGSEDGRDRRDGRDVRWVVRDG